MPGRLRAVGGAHRASTSLAQPTTLDEAVDVIYDMGVRQVFPIHNFDNGFGAAATWMDPIGVGQAIAEQRWWVTRDCGTARATTVSGSTTSSRAPCFRTSGFGVGETPPIPSYVNGNLKPSTASCNEYGLQPLGSQLMQALMNKGMLIDIDHMSANSLDQTIAFTSHGRSRGNGRALPARSPATCRPFDLHLKEFVDNKGRHERMRTRAQLDAIRASGGMVAAMLKDDVQDTDLKGSKFTVPYAPFFGTAIRRQLPSLEQELGAVLHRTRVDVMGGPVAMGSDWNGAAGHLGPRFGSDACGGWGAPNGLRAARRRSSRTSALAYPFSAAGLRHFEPQVTGFKTFDYNVDGLAHIGLVPDMVADLPRLGMDRHYVDSLFCSAEAYIRVWERADAFGARRPVPDPNRPGSARHRQHAARQQRRARSRRPHRRAAGITAMCPPPSPPATRTLAWRRSTTPSPRRPLRTDRSPVTWRW